MSEQILKELVPSISNKVRDSVRDTVRDGVRAQLPVAFRESFESGLLPAFEAGAQTMFQQLQGAFVQGMQGVMQEGLRIQSISAASNEKLEQEVRELRDTVGRLEGTIAALSETVHTLTLTLASGAAHQHIAAAPEAQPLEDAFSLLAQVCTLLSLYLFPKNGVDSNTFIFILLFSPFCRAASPKPWCAYWKTRTSRLRSVCSSS